MAEETTVPAHLDYFPSRLHAAVYRNWEIVPHERLAHVLGTSVEILDELGASLGLERPGPLTPEIVRRNHETVLRRNWPVLPRRQIEALLEWSREDLDHFLATDIAFRVLLGSPPPDLTTVTYSPPTGATLARSAWFAERVRKYRAAAAQVKEEPRLAFINELCRPHSEADLIPGMTPAPGDADLRSGWSIRVPPDAGPVTRTFVADFVDYCTQIHHAHDLSISTSSLSVTATSRTIELALDPAADRGEAYSLEILPEAVRLRASTDQGLARGLIELERRMAERGGPLLAPTGRPQSFRPSFRPRFVYPYFAPMTDVLGQDVVDPCPQGYLARLAHQDADGIWLFCVLQDLVPSPVFEGMGVGSEQRRQRLREIVSRAATYGLKAYLYFNEPRSQPLSFFAKYPDAKGHVEGNLAAMCTSNDAVRRHVRGSLEHLFREVPGLGGTFIITASENLTHCYSHGMKITCERCAKRRPEDVVAELVRCTAEGVHAADPKALVAVWDWSWHNVGIKDPQDEIVRALKPDCALMADFERGTPIRRGGVPMTVDEYSISVVGPGPRASTRADQARTLGLEFLAKIQLSCTWECGTVPFIPVPGLLAEKAGAMRRAGVMGCMGSWTLGSCPSPNTEAFALRQWNPELSVEDTLRRVACRRYGQAAAEVAVTGWMIFGKVFSEEYPYSAAIYNGPIQYAPGLPWYRNRIPAPYGKGAMLNPKDDWKIWTSPYTASQMSAQLRVMCNRWTEGLAQLKETVALAQGARKRTAQLDYGVAWIVDYTFRSFANALDFYQARDRGDAEEMGRITREELAATVQAYHHVLADSRLGWEAQLQYYYQPSDVVERLISLEAVLTPPPEERQ